MEAIVQQLCLQNPGVSEAQVRAYVLERLREQEEREYPTSFTAVQLEDEAIMAQVAPLRIRCHCGACSFTMQVKAVCGSPPKPIRCMCASCRRYHTSAFGAFLRIASAEPRADWTLGGNTSRYGEVCASMGKVERLFCRTCCSKLLTLPVGADSKISDDDLLLALGSVEDSSVPVSWAKFWRSNFETLEPNSSAVWWSAMPDETMGSRRVFPAHGGCACGDCSFVAYLFPGEAQHCYCNACRRLSGAASMTWLPSSNEGFRWTKQDSLRLMRTTRHGQRHMCTRCGSVLTIVYDSQPDCTWPVAGALDDASLTPSNVSWYRVIHICCSMMQPWYELPKDDLPRLKYAG